MSYWSDKAKFEALKKKAEQKKLRNQNKKYHPIIDENWKKQEIERQQRHEEMRPRLKEQNEQLELDKAEKIDRDRKNQVSFDKEVEDIS